MFEIIVEVVAWIIISILLVGPIIGLIVNIITFFTETEEESKERYEAEMRLFEAKAKAIHEGKGKYGWLDR